MTADTIPAAHHAEVVRELRERVRVLEAALTNAAYRVHAAHDSLPLAYCRLQHCRRWGALLGEVAKERA